MSQDFPWSRSFPSSITASLTVVYYSGTVVVPKGNCRQRKASSSTIAVKVNAVVAFESIWREAVSRSVFPINIRFVGHLFCIDEIMCSILSKQNL